MDFAAFARSLAQQHPRRPTCQIAVYSTRSTHLLGRRIVEEYGREGLVPPPADIVAWGQTGGVGRDGRRWSSPPGMGIYATLIRCLDSRERIQRLPLAVVVAACEILDRHLGGGRCRLKWPNDLQVGQRKLGGILIDVLSPAVRRREGQSSSEGATRRLAPVAIISLGVNVRRDERSEAPRATSLEGEGTVAGAAPALDALLTELVGAVDAGLANEERGEPEERLIARYQGLSLHRPGDELRCRVAGGAVSGTFVGFDRHGFLRLDVGGEERRVASGVVDDD